MGEGLDHWVSVDCLEVVDRVLGEDKIAPGHEKAPFDALTQALFDIRNGSIFSEGDHLLSLDDLH